MRAYNQKKAEYRRKHAAYERARKRAEWKKRHDEAAARIFNRRRHSVHVHQAKKMGFNEKKHAPVRVLCPCNNAGARQLAMHEIQMPAIREAAQVTFGDQAEEMLNASIIAPEE